MRITETIGGRPGVWEGRSERRAARALLRGMALRAMLTASSMSPDSSVRMHGKRFWPGGGGGLLQDSGIEKEFLQARLADHLRSFDAVL